MENQFITNISGKVRNTKLPKTKALWPLYELISNAIHAIEERFQTKSHTNGKITISVIRFGSQLALGEISNQEDFPIKSFIVEDNGIGFNQSNYTSFLTSDSEYKIEKGAKGIGRFVCLKAFKEVQYESLYQENEVGFIRKFILKPSGDGIFDYSNQQTTSTNTTFSRVTLESFHPEYQQNCPRKLDEIAYEVIEHFLVLFITNKIPAITLTQEDGKTLTLNSIFLRDFKSGSNETPFKIGTKDFKYYQIRIFHPRPNHSIHYCAVDREVISDNLSKLVPDLGNKLHDEANNFTLAIYITGNYLNENVDSDRTTFLFPDGDDESDKGTQEITLNKIRNKALHLIEQNYETYLTDVREKKFQIYQII